MQNSGQCGLYVVAALFFGAIFFLACLLRADILPLISPEVGDSPVTHHHRATISPFTPRVVCYLTVPGGNDSTTRLDPHNVEANLCTHLVVGFASVVNCTLDLGEQVQFYRDASALKIRNPDLRVMVSVGGMNEISSGFPEMTRNHTNRKKFIKSVLALLKSLHLDGLDVDWEFPAWLDLDGRQRIHFIQLLHELREAFSKHNQKLVLSAAVAASVAMIDQCYNVPEIAEHVDFVNLMTYDYHYYSRLLPFSGLNAPLFPNSKETGFLSTLNVNHSANYWAEQGMPRNKIVVGIPTYGHSYTLFNAENHGIQAPCEGYGLLGSGGFISYETVCSFLKNGATSVFTNDSLVPYAFLDTEWVSYDDIRSVTNKAKWIKSAGFGGGMIFSLNTDNWSATCDGNSTFPLTRAMTKVFRDENNE